MSRAWGWLSSQHVPLSLRCWLYTRYANMYGVNLEEAAYSLEQYNSLCEFFIRPLKHGTRPVAEYEPLVSDDWPELECWPKANNFVEKN